MNVQEQYKLPLENAQPSTPLTSERWPHATTELKRLWSEPSGPAYFVINNGPKPIDASNTEASWRRSLKVDPPLIDVEARFLEDFR